VSGHPGERLSALLDGELSAVERADVEAHLRECAACARELEELAAVDAFAREVPVEAPAGYFDQLPGRVRARVRRPARIPRMAVWAAAAAAAVMAVVVTPVVLQRERSVMAPAPPAVSEATPPATMTPPAVPAAPAAVAPSAGFAEGGAVAGAARAARAKREVLSRLQEREEADKQADKPVVDALDKAQPGHANPDARRDAREPMAPPPAVAAPAGSASRDATAGFEDRAATTPAPKPAMAESVEAQAAAVEGSRVEPDEESKKERARPADRKLAAGGGAFAHPDDRALMTEKRYQALLARPATTAPQARALRDAWELFARDNPADARADEARVRAIEAGVRAWKLGHEDADLAAARARGRAYLAAENAPQAARVRAALEALP
jgi:putative zinc finger protein